MSEFRVRPLVAQPMFQPRRPRPSGGWVAKLRAKISVILEWMRRRGKKKLAKDVVLWGGGLVVLYFFFLWITLPDISDPRNIIPSHSSTIVDRNGTELYRLFRDENRSTLDDDQIPDDLKKAIVAIEDERFYDRGCLDVRALARVVFFLGQAGGASTLTRQLARNALNLQQENIINRKFKEIILGCQMERQYTKDQLLSLYLNWIPFGSNAYGAELASEAFFGTPAKDLSLAQSAILASIPQRPTYFSPYGKHTRTTVSEDVIADIVAGRVTSAADISDDDVSIGLLGNNVGTGSTTVYVGGRTDQVLKNMEELGFIDESRRLQALEELETIEFKPSRENIRAPHFVLWVRQQVEDMLKGSAEEGMLEQGGLIIETTLDWDMQQAAETAVANKRDDIAKLYGAHNIALVAADPVTKDILAYVGNANYEDEENDGKVDMARAPRQPGSSFKPIVYTSAFEQGYGPATVLYDVPTKIGENQPQNFDGKFWGMMTIRKALASSRNIPAAKAYFMAGGEQKVLDTAARLGALAPRASEKLRKEEDPDFEYGWPLAIGAAETPLTEMVQAYSTFADGGMFAPLRSITRVKDSRGNILFEAEPADPVEAIDPRIAYQITSILSDVSARPNDYWQQVLSVPGTAAAAKTGTSNKCLETTPDGSCTLRKPLDLWTMGYTPNIVAGVWVGNADSVALSDKAESLITASPIWKDFMTRAQKFVKNPVASFPAPSGIVLPQVSALSGELPTDCTPVDYRKSDVFLEELAPQLDDPVCVKLSIDRVTGLLASDACPADAAQELSFIQPKEVLSDRFPQWQTAVLEWAKKETGTWDPLTNSFKSASGSSLPLPLPPTDKCDPRLTPGRMEKPEVSLRFPQDGGSAPYPSFQLDLEVNVGSKVRSVTVTIDGKNAASSDNVKNVVVQVPRSVQKNGNHTLEVTVTDEYFNTATDSADISFEEDTTDPEVTLVSPSDGANIVSGSELTIRANASDPQGGIKYVQFYLENRLLTTKPTAPYELKYPVDLKPGTYTFSAKATDFAGNESEDEAEVTIGE